MIATSTSSIADSDSEATSEFSSASSYYRRSSEELERNERIEQYFPLVEKILGTMLRRLPTHVSADDLRSAGTMGLISAAERFDSAQAAAFAGYACVRIRGAILDELRRIDPCSRRSRQLAKKIESATQETAQALGRAPSDEEVSTRLRVSSAEFARLRERASPVRIVSLDVSPDTGESTGGILHEIIPDDQEDAREKMEREDLLKSLAERITELPDLQKKILALYYFEGMRFAEIGEAFDLTESRISQIHKKAVLRLRALMRSERAG